MGLTDPELILVAMHSAHEHFRPMRVNLELPDALHGGLPVRHLQEGTLADWHPKAEQFLEVVLADLKKGAERGSHGSVHIVMPDPNKGPMTMRDVWNHAESHSRTIPGGADVIMVDHMGLLSAPKGSGRETWERASVNYQEAHRMALGFDHGRGIGVVALNQINREGGKRVLALAEGSRVPRYDLTHVADSLEAAKSADIVTTSYVDEKCKAEGRVLMDCLKARGRPQFAPFLASIHWDTMRMRVGENLMDPSDFFGASEDDPKPSKKGSAKPTLTPKNLSAIADRALD